jgi:hypothetical protein
MRTKEKSFTLLILVLLAMAIMMLSCRKDDEPEAPIDEPLGMINALGQLEGTTNKFDLFC